MRNITNLVQNNFVAGEPGLSGPGYATDTHDSGEDDVWHHASGDNNPFVTLDLGANYNLLITRIWNLNQGQNTDNQNGAKDVRISTSADNVTFTILETNTVAEGPGGTNNEWAQDFSTPASGIRYVKLEPLDGYGGSGDWRGLGAVRFVVAGPQSPPLISATLQGLVGQHYQVQNISALGTGHWQTLVDLPALPNSPYNMHVLDGLVPGNPGQQFYRAIWVP